MRPRFLRSQLPFQGYSVRRVELKESSSVYMTLAFAGVALMAAMVVGVVVIRRRNGRHPHHQVTDSNPGPCGMRVNSPNHRSQSQQRTRRPTYPPHTLTKWSLTGTKQLKACSGKLPCLSKHEMRYCKQTLKRPWCG